MAKMLRGLVSKKKKRFTEDGFDLDLSYITPQLIAMGYPTEGREAAYRNPYKQVYQFLEKRHHGHYKVYNLCSEKNRQYDPAKFNNAMVCFPFDDHHPPPFELIEQFCIDLKQYLDEDPKNVAAIHCKAGKGRTGTMIISYMLYAQLFSDPEHAKRYYASMRTYNRKGLTIPSQIRYVDYFYASLKNRALVESDQAPTLVLTSLKIVPPPFVERLELLRFTVHCNRQLIYEHNKPLSVDQQMVSSAMRVAQSAIQSSNPSKPKLEKAQKCDSCQRVHSTKDNAWVICSACGNDTCIRCTEKRKIDTGGSVLDAPVERFVCTKCFEDKGQDHHEILLDHERQFMERFQSQPDPGSDEFALVMEPDKVLSVKGDVKVSIYHKAPKPLIHFWINTRFHTQFPIVLDKFNIDGAHKDFECKSFPPDFRLVVDMRPAEAGEQMIPLSPTSPAAAASSSSSGKKGASATTVSGFVIEPNGSVVFNQATTTGIHFGLDISTELTRNAIAMVRGFGQRVGDDEDVTSFSKEGAHAMAKSLDYQALLGRLGSLNMVQFSDTDTDDELLAFWLNMYHLLSILSFVEMYPKSLKDRARNGRNCHLCVAGDRLSLFQIEFGILRSASTMPSLPQSLLGSYSRRVHRFGAFLQETDFLRRIVTFGISYFCSGTPGVQAYVCGNDQSVSDQILANGARYLQKSGIVISPKKQLVVISSYLEWFQSDKDSQNIQLAVSNWLQVLGPWFDESLSIEMKNHETFKFKFEDNVMLDQIQMFCPAEKATETQSGVHRAPTLPELPPMLPASSDGANDNNESFL